VISFATDTITVVRAERVTDSRNDVHLDWTDPDEHDVERCRWQPNGGDLLQTRRSGVVILAVVHAPTSADVTVDDRVKFNGVTYDIDSPIDLWRGPSGALAHLEIALRAVKG
jgi:hypothetical protein